METTGSERPAKLFPPEIQRARVQRVMEQELTEKQRRVIEDHYLRGMRVTDIASLYGVNKSTVSRTLRRAMKRLRRSLRY